MSSRRGRDERGVALSSPLALLSAAAVVVAGVAFVATNQGDTPPPAPASAPVRVTTSAAPTPSVSATPTPVRRKRKAPVVRRGQTFVEVFNNSGIHGLAGSTAAKAQGAGWQVVGADNWYGTVDATTVYYPARLRAAAKVLAKDLGIRRVKPLIAPMRGDRLTVILTTDYFS